MDSDHATPDSAIAAATRKAIRYAVRLATGCPATRCTGPTSTMTVVSTATPTAPPSWRTALNMVEARPVAAGVIVANDAAWTGTNTWAMARPSVSMSSRAHHRLVPGPSSASSPTATAVPHSPVVMGRGGPSRGYNTRLASCAPPITPNASGNVLSPDPS